jgi:hypothetical protein
MNNQITIIIIALVAIGIMSSMASASALTNVDRYNSGYRAAETIINDKQVLMNTMFGPAFSSGHTDAYRNGFIAAVDSSYSLSLPYTDYSPSSEAHSDNSGETDPTFVFYHQSTAPSQ